MEMGSMSSDNGIQETMPVFDSFTVVTIGLAAIAVGSGYFYKRSKQKLKKTVELLES
jgi:hypothetical protein